MKTKILLLLFSIAGMLTVSAQTKENGFFVEMNFGYCETLKLESGNPGHKLCHYEDYMIYTPIAGYQINNRWAVGLKVQLEEKSVYVESQYDAVGIFAQYRFFNRKWLKLFVEGSVSHGFVDDDKLLYDRDYTEFGFNFGLAVPIYRGLSFMARYLHVGYSDVDPTFRRHYEGSAYWGDGNWVVDGNLRRLLVGLQYRF